MSQHRVLYLKSGALLISGGSGNWERQAAIVDLEGAVSFLPNMLFEHKDHAIT